MRFAAPWFAAVTVLLVAWVATLTGCSQANIHAINTAPLPSSDVKLSRNPEHIYVAPFRYDNAKLLVGDDRDANGYSLILFKEKFQTQFSHELIKRLTKLAPTEMRWQELPEHGWLVTGDFITVYQGSRALRATLGFDFGQTYLQTNVYVYDLDVSKTQYLLAFRTGVPDDNGDGVGSGNLITEGVNPASSLEGLGAGLKLDTVNTTRAIRNVLAQYCTPFPPDLH